MESRSHIVIKLERSWLRMFHLLSVNVMFDVASPCWPWSNTWGYAHAGPQESGRGLYRPFGWNETRQVRQLRGYGSGRPWVPGFAMLVLNTGDTGEWWGRILPKYKMSPKPPIGSNVGGTGKWYAIIIEKKSQKPLMGPIFCDIWKDIGDWLFIKNISKTWGDNYNGCHSFFTIVWASYITC